MNFRNELEFEQHIRELIDTRIIRGDDLVMLKNKKTVDILICRNRPNPKLFFIEIKYHQTKHGRIGTGHGKGGGIQPEILKRQPKYFEKYMKWIFGCEGTKGYFVLSNKVLGDKYMAGQSIGTKHNNFRVALFRETNSLTENELVNDLKKWFKT